jgi:hypothetical protein
VNQIDVEETNHQIAEYKQKNKTQIAKNTVKIVSNSMVSTNTENVKEKKNVPLEEKKELNENMKQTYQPKYGVKAQPSITGQHSKIQWESLTEEEQEKIIEKRKQAGGYDVKSGFEMKIILKKRTKRAFQEAFSSILPTKLSVE